METQGVEGQFGLGQRVRINRPGHPLHGKKGMIVKPTVCESCDACMCEREHFAGCGYGL